MKHLILIFIFLLFSQSRTQENGELGEKGELGEVTELTEQGEGEFGEATEAEEVFEATPLIIEETLDRFVTLDPSVVQTDTKIAGILYVGLQEATSQAINNGSLIAFPYELAEVYSVQQNIANPDEYRFDVSVRNPIPSFVRMNFDLIYNESSNTVEILSWGFPDGCKEENFTVDAIPEGYQEIEFDLNDQNSFVNQLEDLGFQVVVTTGVFKGIIPSYYYKVTNVYSVSEKLEGGLVYYRFDLDAADAYGNTARFMYVVSYETATETSKLEEMQITNVVRVSD